MNIEHTNHVGHRLVVDSTTFHERVGRDPDRHEIRDWVFSYDSGVQGRKWFHSQPGSTYEQSISQLFRWFRNWNASPTLTFTVGTLDES